MGIDTDSDMLYDQMKEDRLILRMELERKHGKDNVWDTDELREQFEVLGFCMGICVVRRKSDMQKGSLEFVHSPRLYYGFMPA